MKKNLVKMMLAAIVVLASGVNIYNSQKVSGMSDVVLANVDALAEIEINSDATFLELNNAILDSVKYSKDQLTSFFN